MISQGCIKNSWCHNVHFLRSVIEIYINRLLTVPKPLLPLNGRRSIDSETSRELPVNGVKLLSSILSILSIDSKGTARLCVNC